jgi:Co/Zn/Cd efflux system component
MKQTTYHVEHMDCAAEEQIIRMGLEGVSGVDRLVFDLPARRLIVYHTDEAEAVWPTLDGLNLGARKVETAIVVDANLPPIPETSSTGERGPLVWALAINATLFVGELIAGLLAGSMGLVADALDMLADALVYALSLAAVGTSISRKKNLAGLSGYLQFSLAVFGLIEVSRRFVTGEGVPDVTTMIVVAAIALAGNVATLMILSKAKRGEAHVEASWIFTSNDVKVNALVIVSAVFVWLLDSEIPDLFAGAFIFLIVANGARRILALSR